jgi:hypothetical protein
MDINITLEYVVCDPAYVVRQLETDVPSNPLAQAAAHHIFQIAALKP